MEGSDPASFLLFRPLSAALYTHRPVELPEDNFQDGDRRTLVVTIAPIDSTGFEHCKSHFPFAPRMAELGFGADATSFIPVDVVQQHQKHETRGRTQEARHQAAQRYGINGCGLLRACVHAAA